VRDAVNARMHVALNRPAVEYSRGIFGHFIEHFHRQIHGGLFDPGSPLSDERGFRTDVIEALQEMRPEVVRWPGGCFVSAYHWLDGIGPDRVPSYDKAWRVEDPNTFGTDEFVEWCRAVGTTPYICTNGGTGTAEEMSDWVEYCNLPESGRWARRRTANGHPEPHAVPYWSIGNENYGHWEMGAKGAEEWARLVTEAAKMMRRVDPTISLLAAARADLDWTLPLLRSAGQYLDYVSIHGYWDDLQDEDEPSDYLTCVSRSLQPEAAIRRVEDVIGAAGLDGRVAIAFDEWNLRGWHHPWGSSPEAIGARDRNDENSTYTMADAVFSAGFLNSCLRHADTVRMANLAPMVNARGPLYVHPDGLVRRTTFHVMSMYATMLPPEIADCSIVADTLAHGVTDVPVVDGIAACDAERSRVVLVLVNRHPEQPMSCAVELGDGPLTGSHPGTVLAGDDPDAYNSVAAPRRVEPKKETITFEDGVTWLPPHSITFCEVSSHTAPAVATGEWSVGARGGWRRNA
jgi:alpha-N-arabinofuranosidase